MGICNCNKQYSSKGEEYIQSVISQSLVPKLQLDQLEVSLINLTDNDSVIHADKVHKVLSLLINKSLSKTKQDFLSSVFSDMIILDDNNNFINLYFVLFSLYSIFNHAYTTSRELELDELLQDILTKKEYTYDNFRNNMSSLEINTWGITNSFVKEIAKKEKESILNKEELEEEIYEIKNDILELHYGPFVIDYVDEFCKDYVFNITDEKYKKDYIMKIEDVNSFMKSKKFVFDYKELRNMFIDAYINKGSSHK